MQEATSDPNCFVSKGPIALVIRLEVGPSACMVRGATLGDVSRAILGPIWVWMVINEQPSPETILGGIVIIITIAIHSFLAIKKTQLKSTQR